MIFPPSGAPIRCPAHAALLESERVLTSNFRAIRRARSFDELHAHILDAIGGIGGAGAAMVYDAAILIGARLGVAPTRVYLRAGTTTGPRALRLVHRHGRVGRIASLHSVVYITCVFQDQH